MKRRSYWDLMQKYGQAAAIPKPKRRFHALRHAIVVHLLDLTFRTLRHNSEAFLGDLRKGRLRAVRILAI